MNHSKVIIKKTNPITIWQDYEELMELAEFKKYLPVDQDTIIKLNLSWTKFFPSSSTPPWQFEGVVKTLLKNNYKKIYVVENKTVCTNLVKGLEANKWNNVIKKYNLNFIPLPETEWIKYKFKNELLMIDKIFPEGILIPKLFIGKNILHLPTLKVHGHSITTGATKNAFGGLLKEVRHYCHKYIHEVLVDLIIMQKELHPNIFAIMDGTVCGDGKGPRTMYPVIKNYILASSDSIAIDAVSAKMMGFNPLEIPYIRMAQERNLGCGNINNIEIIGEDISNINFNFRSNRSMVIFVDQLIRKGALQFLEKILLHSPLMVWAPFASNIYHDYLWYPFIGKKRVNEFMKTEWGKLFQEYK